MRSSPRVHRKADARAASSAAKAEPVAFRHRVAWQYCIGESVPSISNATAPHKQRPVTMTAPLC
jgi:hypothetical protein